VTLLRQLRVVERLIGSLEISAAVLKVGIKEERIKPPIEIIVMRDVASRPRRQVELLQAAAHIAQPPLWRRPQRQHLVALLEQHEREKIGDRPAFDDQRAIHIGFAKMQFRIEQQTPLGAGRSDSDDNGTSMPVPEGEGRPPRRDDSKVAAPNKRSQCRPKQPVHGRLRPQILLTRRSVRRWRPQRLTIVDGAPETRGITSKSGYDGNERRHSEMGPHLSALEWLIARCGRGPLAGR
jgi:hypothetical protein